MALLSEYMYSRDYEPAADLVRRLLKATPNDPRVLTASAANNGGWGNFIRLDIDNTTSNPDSTFNLSVARFQLKNGTLQLADGLRPTTLPAVNITTQFKHSSVVG